LYRKINDLWRFLKEVERATRIMVVARAFLLALFAISTIYLLPGWLDLVPGWLDLPSARSGREDNDDWVFEIVMVISLGYLLYNVFDNRRKLRRAIDQFDGSRARVESALRSLPTSRVRLQYVRKLSVRSADYARYLASPDNQWPNGTRPNFGDQASTELAKLDGRWHGYE
jgi:hypothetical protein